MYIIMNSYLLRDSDFAESKYTQFRRNKTYCYDHVTEWCNTRENRPHITDMTISLFTLET